jgi:hypothetical protein
MNLLLLNAPFQANVRKLWIDRDTENFAFLSEGPLSLNATGFTCQEERQESNGY